MSALKRIGAAINRILHSTDSPKGYFSPKSAIEEDLCQNVTAPKDRQWPPSSTTSISSDISVIEKAQFENWSETAPKSTDFSDTEPSLSKEIGKKSGLMLTTDEEAFAKSKEYDCSESAEPPLKKKKVGIQEDHEIANSKPLEDVKNDDGSNSSGLSKKHGPTPNSLELDGGSQNPQTPLKTNEQRKLSHIEIETLLTQDEEMRAKDQSRKELLDSLRRTPVSFPVCSVSFLELVTCRFGVECVMKSPYGSTRKSKRVLTSFLPISLRYFTNCRTAKNLFSAYRTDWSGQHYWLPLNQGKMIDYLRRCMADHSLANIFHMTFLKTHLEKSWESAAEEAQLVAQILKTEFGDQAGVESVKVILTNSRNTSLGVELGNILISSGTEVAVVSEIKEAPQLVLASNASEPSKAEKTLERLMGNQVPVSDERILKFQERLRLKYIDPQFRSLETYMEQLIRETESRRQKLLEALGVIPVPFPSNSLTFLDFVSLKYALSYRKYQDGESTSVTQLLTSFSPGSLRQIAAQKVTAAFFAAYRPVWVKDGLRKLQHKTVSYFLECMKNHSLIDVAQIAELKEDLEALWDESGKEAVLISEILSTEIREHTCIESTEIVLMPSQKNAHRHSVMPPELNNILSATADPQTVASLIRKLPSMEALRRMRYQARKRGQPDPNLSLAAQQNRLAQDSASTRKNGKMPPSVLSLNPPKEGQSTMDGLSDGIQKGATIPYPACSPRSMLELVSKKPAVQCEMQLPGRSEKTTEILSSFTISFLGTFSQSKMASRFWEAYRDQWNKGKLAVEQQNMLEFLSLCLEDISQLDVCKMKKHKECVEEEWKVTAEKASLAVEILKVGHFPKSSGVEFAEVVLVQSQVMKSGLENLLSSATDPESLAAALNMQMQGTASSCNNAWIKARSPAKESPPSTSTPLSIQSLSLRRKGIPCPGCMDPRRIPGPVSAHFLKTMESEEERDYFIEYSLQRMTSEEYPLERGWCRLTLDYDESAWMVYCIMEVEGSDPLPRSGAVLLPEYPEVWGGIKLFFAMNAVGLAFSMIQNCSSMKKVVIFSPVQKLGYRLKSDLDEGSADEISKCIRALLTQAMRVDVRYYADRMKHGPIFSLES